MTYPQIIQLLTTNLAVNFDKVYHSAEIVTNDMGEKFPAVSIRDEWISLVPTDTTETVYVRRAGNDEFSSDLRIGSCVKSYIIRAPVRVVYFSDRVTRQEEILFKLLQSILVEGTTLRSVIRDKWNLQKDESTGSYGLGATSCYLAVDLFAMYELSSDLCAQDFCIDIENPICKTT